MGSLPNHYQAKNQAVRTRFDALENEFAAILPEVLGEAVRAKQTNNEAAAHILDEFTESCVNKVMIALEELTKECG